MPKKLNIPIDHFNALRNVTISKKVSADEIAANTQNLGALVGSALQQAGPVPAAIDLIPDSVKEDREMEKRKPYLIMAAAALTALILALGFFFQRGASLANQKADDISVTAQKMVDANKAIENLKADIAKIDQKQEPFVEAIKHRLYWAKVFNYLSGKMESDTMWITGLVPLSNGQPVIAEGEDELIGGTVGGVQTIDSFLITGLWRENPLSSKVVFNYFNLLQADAIQAKEKGGLPLFDLADRDISEFSAVDTGTAGDRYAYPWEFRLPLPEDNQVKFTK